MFAKFFAVCAFTLVLQHEVSGSLLNKLFDLDDQVVHDDKECKDLRDDCSNLPAKGDQLIKYCEYWKDDVAVKECPMTCGRCKAPAPPVGCHDERDDCNWITHMYPNPDDLDEYCASHRNDKAIKQCKKTCRLCNAPFPPGPNTGCKDERPDCSWITTNNPDPVKLAKYCIEYKDDPAVKQCKKTCGFCKDLP